MLHCSAFSRKQLSSLIDLFCWIGSGAILCWRHPSDPRTLWVSIEIAQPLTKPASSISAPWPQLTCLREPSC
eukprot:1161476-Pelagomonas_calceolata.AAC.1